MRSSSGPATRWMPPESTKPCPRTGVSPVHDSVLDAVGGTPLISLGRLAPAGSRIYLKCEQYNPGGSHKARIALNMVLQAERDGWLTRGSGQTILEPTGGNTGIGVAMAGTVLGYRVVLVVPDNYSPSK